MSIPIYVSLVIIIIIIYIIHYMSIPIYVSLTSIYSNQDILLKTLLSIINQTRPPNKIYLNLSEEPFILDKGFANKIITNNNLLSLIENNKEIIELEWVKNIGPYRKLIPLMMKKWEEDCIIITIDDDIEYNKTLIENMVKDYEKYRCVINYRAFTPLLRKGIFSYDDRKKPRDEISLYNFATGIAGILYKPEFFYKTKELFFNKSIYMKICGKQDDIWFYIMRIMNNVKCYAGNDNNEKKWAGNNNSRHGLYSHFNSKNDNNTIIMRRTLKELDFHF